MLVRTLLALAVTLPALTLSSAAVLAQSPAPAWPHRPVKFIVPLGPGSGADIGARLAADRLAQRWGQGIVIENRPGGDSIVAIGAFTSASDDHTLLWGPSAAFVAHPYQHAKLPYDPADLVPIARYSNTLDSICVPSGMKANSLGDVVALIRAEPGKLNWASVTGLNDFLMRSFVKSANLDIGRVPYRDAVQAANDLGEERIQLFVAAYAITRPQIESGKIKILAITNTAPAKALPGVPTARQAGFPVMEFDGLVGLYGPRNMSPQVRDRISADVVAVAADPEIDAKLAVTGQVANPGTAAEFAASIAAQREVAAAAARILGLEAAK